MLDRRLLCGEYAIEPKGPRSGKLSQHAKDKVLE